MLIKVFFVIPGFGLVFMLPAEFFHAIIRCFILDTLVLGIINVKQIFTMNCILEPRCYPWLGIQSFKFSAGY